MTTENALSILAKDVKKIEDLAKEDSTLDKVEATKLTDYIKTLIAVHKEEREQVRADQLVTKSDEELENLAKQALEFLNAPGNEEEPKKEERNEQEDTNPIPQGDTSAVQGDGT
jgi:hypothetical protein